MTEPNVSRPDLERVASVIEDYAKVLDVGCGSGALLDIISSRSPGARLVGIEISQDGVNECVRKGFSVVQGDADSDLESYVGGVFDWVVLSHLIQYIRDPRHVIEKAVEIGNSVVVSFYNVAHWRSRASFALRGRIPPSPPARPSDYDSACRMLSIRDFEVLCDSMDVIVKRKTVLDASGRAVRPTWLQNICGCQAIYILSKKGQELERRREYGNV